MTSAAATYYNRAMSAWNWLLCHSEMKRRRWRRERRRSRKKVKRRSTDIDKCAAVKRMATEWFYHYLLLCALFFSLSSVLSALLVRSLSFRIITRMGESIKFQKRNEKKKREKKKVVLVGDASCITFTRIKDGIRVKCTLSRRVNGTQKNETKSKRISIRSREMVRTGNSAKNRNSNQSAVAVVAAWHQMAPTPQSARAHIHTNAECGGDVNCTIQDKCFVLVQWKLIDSRRVTTIPRNEYVVKMPHHTVSASLSLGLSLSLSQSPSFSLSLTTASSPHSAQSNTFAIISGKYSIKIIKCGSRARSGEHKTKNYCGQS